MRAYLEDTPAAEFCKDQILEVNSHLPMSDYENLRYWLIDSKESFHGEQVKEYFVFKDGRLPEGTFFPMSLVRLDI